MIEGKGLVKVEAVNHQDISGFGILVESYRNCMVPPVSPVPELLSQVFRLSVNVPPAIIVSVEAYGCLEPADFLAVGFMLARLADGDGCYRPRKTSTIFFTA